MDTMKNKYIVRSRISEKKFREILWYFSSDIEGQFGGFAQLPVQQDFVVSACQGVFDAAQRIH